MRATSKKEMRSDMIIHVDRTVVAHNSIYSSIHDMLEEIKQAFANEDSIDFYVNNLRKSYDKFIVDEVKSQYSFNTPGDTVVKNVHWYLMMADSYYSKPQREEFFVDSGYYKYHEAFHLLRFANERQILEKAYNEYINIRRQGRWE